MLIGLTGRASAGKDTCYQRLSLMTPARRVSFADKVYQSAAYSLGVAPETLRVLKNEPAALLTLEAPTAEDDPREAGQVIVSQLTVREYLQLLGTEGHRAVFGDNFWVDAVRLDHTAAEMVVVTDCRFENEAAAIREHGGTIVRVIGPGEVEDVEDSHASEAGLPRELVDYEIPNDVRDDHYESLDGWLWALVQEYQAGHLGALSSDAARLGALLDGDAA